MNSTSPDVIVVGAGPVGLSTTLMLAQRGWRVTCIERWATPYHLPRAITLDHEAMRILQHIGLAEETNKIGETNDFYEWVNADNETLLLFDHTGPGPSGWRGVLFSQPELEKLLERTAIAHPLVTVIRGQEVVEIVEHEDGVTVALRDTQTQEPAGSMSASYVVGGDGANSIVRETIDVPMVDLGFFYDWLVVDIIPQDGRVWEPRSYQICDPKRPTTFVPGGPGRRRWEFMVLPGESHEEISATQNVWKLLEPWDINAGNALLERAAVYTFQARWARIWNRGRLAIAGDAAHLVPPFAGQGLCSGLRDAENLAWKLDLVLRGAAPQELLDTYTIERTEHVQYAVHFSTELGKVICILDPEKARERDERMVALKGDAALALPQLPPAAFTRGIVAPDDERFVAGIPGTLVPQFTVRGELASGFFDDIVGIGASLVLDAQIAAELPDELLARFAALDGRVVRFVPATGVPERGCVVDSADGYAGELARIGAAAFLARPDGYYFGAAREPEAIAALIEEYVNLIGSRGNRLAVLSETGAA